VPVLFQPVKTVNLLIHRLSLPCTFHLARAYFTCRSWTAISLAQAYHKAKQNAFSWLTALLLPAIGIKKHVRLPESLTLDTECGFNSL